MRAGAISPVWKAMFFDTAIEYQTMGRLNIKKQVLPFLYGLLAVNLFTTVPVELFRFSVNLQNTFAKDLANEAIGMNLNIQHLALDVLAIYQTPVIGQHNVLLNLLILICLGYCVIKCFFANIKRGGILLTQIAVGSLYLFSLPRGMTEGFTGWCKQIVALCFTTFMQTTLLMMGLITMQSHPLLGLGVMLSAISRQLSIHRPMQIILPPDREPSGSALTVFSHPETNLLCCQKYQKSSITIKEMCGQSSLLSSGRMPNDWGSTMPPDGSL